MFGLVCLQFCYQDNIGNISDWYQNLVIVFLNALRDWFYISMATVPDCSIRSSHYFGVQKPMACRRWPEFTDLVMYCAEMTLNDSVLLWKSSVRLLFVGCLALAWWKSTRRLPIPSISRSGKNSLMRTMVSDFKTGDYYVSIFFSFKLHSNG